MFDKITQLFKTPENIFCLATDMLTGLGVLAVLASVAANFFMDETRDVRQGKRSGVATGSMLAFFVGVYFLLRFHLGSMETPMTMGRIVLTVAGLVVFLFGAFFNIWGRFYLGKNWANHIKIYDEHTMVVTGPYAIVRHPLYASLIWMCYAASIIYLNAAVFLANTLIFIPMMYYRAKQEEALLGKTFSEYGDYCKRVGMFFPRWIKERKSS